MDLGAHENMFCPAMQFNTWHELLVEEVEVVKHERALGSVAPASQINAVLEVKTKEFHYVWASVIYNCDPRV